MNAVIVDGDVSYPPTSGKRLRTLHLLLRLARRHRLTYIGRCDAKSEEARQAREFLGDHGIEPILVDHPVPRKTGLAFCARLAANLLSPLPYSAASHQSTRMRRVVGEYAASHEVDVWQFEWTPYLDTLTGHDDACRVLIAHNVDTLIWQRYHETARGLLRRFYIRQQWRKFERFERRCFRAATWVVAVSEDDARLVREQFGMPRVDVVDNGIDRACFAAVQGERDPRRILFLGALDWRPNLDAVGRLLVRIFPAVLAQEPAARLLLVGRNPPPALVQRVAETPRVELYADVPDVRPYLGTSGVMTVPLRIGGGSRLKILEALACGLPVVSSRVGMEGLCLLPGEDLVIADSDEEMAQALVDCLRRPVLAQQMAERARSFVLQRYDWDVLADKLEQVWEKAVQTVRGAGEKQAWSSCS
jgi:glycosyltransferase involved in cell wall biosynthesis